MTSAVRRKAARTGTGARGVDAVATPRRAPLPSPNPQLERIATVLGWAALGAAAIFVLLLASQRIISTDYWWQLQTGEDIAKSGIPRVDTYSFTNPGAPRYEVRWLYCLGLHALVSTFGAAGASLLKSLLVLGMFALAVWTARPRLPSVVAAVVVVIAALGASQRLVLRPEILSYALVVAFAAIVERLRRGPSRWQWALPVLGALWANVHGFFLLGPAILGAWLVAEILEAGIVRPADPDRRRRIRTAALALLVTSLATLANPYGARTIQIALQQFFDLHGVTSTLFTELRSPFDFAQYFTAIRWYKILLGVVAAAALIALRRQSIFWILLVGSQLWLSTSAVRNVPLFCAVAVPYVLLQVGRTRLLDRPAVRRALPVMRIAAALAVILFTAKTGRDIVTDRFYVRQSTNNQFGLSVAPHTFFERATDFLDTTGLRGPILCNETTGAYLISRGYQVFFDPRGDLYTDEFIEAYRDFIAKPTSEMLSMIVQHYDLRIAFIDLRVPLLVELLDTEPRWRLVYLDGQAALFMRDDTGPNVPKLDLAANGQAWLASLRTDLPPARALESLGFFDRVSNPVHYSHLARILFETRRYDLAEPLLRDALAAWPLGAPAWQMLGHIGSVRRDYALAYEGFTRALQEQDDNGELHRQAGMAALQLNRIDDAERHADRAVALVPNDWRVQALEGLVEIQKQRPAEAEKWLRAALEQVPEDAALWRNLGIAQYRQGRVAEAVASSEKAFGFAPRDVGLAAEIASLHQELGASVVARAWVERALILDPNHKPALALRAKLGGAP